MKIRRVWRGRYRRLGSPRMLIAVVASCCAGGLAVAATSAAARSPTVILTCLLSQQFTFSPPLDFNTAAASGKGLASSCVSPNGSHPRLKSGVVFNTVGATATGCAPLPLKLIIQRGSIFWNDGTESTLDADVSTDATTGTLGFNAVFTSGPMAGAKIAGVPVIIGQQGLCLLGGVRSFGLAFGAIVVTETQRSRKASRARTRAGHR